MFIWQINTINLLYIRNALYQLDYFKVLFKPFENVEKAIHSNRVRVAQDAQRGNSPDLFQWRVLTSPLISSMAWVSQLTSGDLSLPVCKWDDIDFILLTVYIIVDTWKEKNSA